MNQDVAKEVIKELEGMFDRQFKAEAIPAIMNCLREVEPQVAVNVLKKYEGDPDLVYRPHPKQFMLDIQLEHRRQNKSPDSTLAALQNLPGSSRANDLNCKICIAITDLIFSGKATRAEIVEKLREAEGVSPGLGWREASNNLAGYYVKHGMSREGTPALHIAEIESKR